MGIFDKVLRANEIYATTIPFNNPSWICPVVAIGTLSDGVTVLD
jgi:hypothetical protein